MPLSSRVSVSSAMVPAQRRSGSSVGACQSVATGSLPLSVEGGRGAGLASAWMRENCDLVRGGSFRAANQLQLEVFESCVGMPRFFTAEHLPASSPLEVVAPFVRHHPEKSLEPEVGP